MWYPVVIIVMNFLITNWPYFVYLLVDLGFLSPPEISMNIAKLSSMEISWVGSTSGATVANVSNIDVFEVGTNIVLLSWNSLRELPHSTNVSQDCGSWLFLPARAWDIIFGSGRERTRAKKFSSLHSVCLGSLNWNETGSDLLVSED